LVARAGQAPSMSGVVTLLPVLQTSKPGLAGAAVPNLP